MVKINWSIKASNDIEAICNYIEQDSPNYARIFTQNILYAIEKLSDFPEIGRIVPEFRNPILREILFKSYRIIYRVIKEELDIKEIEIVKIFHGSRLLSNKDL